MVKEKAKSEAKTGQKWLTLDFFLELCDKTNFFYILFEWLFDKKCAFKRVCVNRPAREKNIMWERALLHIGNTGTKSGIT